MISKSKRTLEKYMEAGAKIRLLKQVLSEAYCEASGLLYAKDSDRFYKATKTIEELSSILENNMFNDLKLCGNEYIDVFFGSTRTYRYNDIDKKMRELITDVLKSYMPKE